jgi:hypothetical protein
VVFSSLLQAGGANGANSAYKILVVSYVDEVAPMVGRLLTAEYAALDLVKVGARTGNFACGKAKQKSHHYQFHRGVLSEN